jgi:LmbE family N-acetylglucosaminyl deacetylase
MHWIYLSPHLDDVALSGGGLVWQQTQAGEFVEIWTICAGDPPEQPISAFAESLHQRWQTISAATELRRQEDRNSCQAMGASYRHFNLPDCVYRLGPPGTPVQDLALYDLEESLWGEIHPAESGLLATLGKQLSDQLPQDCEIVCPLALGGHVDHRLTRGAAESLGHHLWYYADYPYALKSQVELEALKCTGWQAVQHPISAEGLYAWISAVAAHRSQISTFWSIDSDRRIPAEEAMRQAITQYCQELGGVWLWRRSS